MASIADGSFRDPHARLHQLDDRILRVLDDSAADSWRSAVESGLMSLLVERGMLVDTHEVAAPDGVIGALVLESDILRPISYPYEWSFSMLQDAALLTLDVCLEALSHGHELKDASSYNVVFDGCTPRFVDIGSFAGGFSGHWRGYGQFVDHFLGPLLLSAHLGLAHQRYLRGHLDGIPVADLARIFSGRRRFRAGVFRHVVLRAAIDKRSEGFDASRRTEVRTSATLTVEVVVRTIQKIRKLIESLEYAGDTEWSSYAQGVPYSNSDHERKKLKFRELCNEVPEGALAWDVGANDGTFSEILTERFGRVVAIDSDPGAVERNYLARRSTPSARQILPALVDISDPSAGRGWRNKERLSLQERGRPVLSSWLAIIHHLSISGAVPLGMVVESIAATSDYAIVEWVDPTDPQVELLMAGFADGDRRYTRALFDDAVEGVSEVIATAGVSETRQLLLLRALNSPS